MTRRRALPARPIGAQGPSTYLWNEALSLTFFLLSGLEFSIFGIAKRATSGGNKLKNKIHPKYEAAKVSCACGNNFETRTTVGDINVEICSACHPFFTGKQKLVDTAGRVEKYRRKYQLENK